MKRCLGVLILSLHLFSVSVHAEMVNADSESVFRANSIRIGLLSTDYRGADSRGPALFWSPSLRLTERFALQPLFGAASLRTSDDKGLRMIHALLPVSFRFAAMFSMEAGPGLATWTSGDSPDTTWSGFLNWHRSGHDPLDLISVGYTYFRFRGEQADHYWLLAGVNF